MTQVAGGWSRNSDTLRSACEWDPRNSPWAHLGDDPATFIVVDTDDAGNGLEVSRGQQLIGVSGQEDAIHHRGNHLEGLATAEAKHKICGSDFSLRLLTMPCPSQQAHYTSPLHGV